VNFVAKGTIEEGMLSVLKFKKSLFAGVLDGGDKDVFLGGSKLNKFMETVEKATAAIPEAMLEDAEEALVLPRDAVAEEGRTGDGQPPPRAGRKRRPEAPSRVAEPVGAGLVADEEPEEAPTAAAAPANPWAGLLQVGMALLQQVSTAAQPGAPDSSRPASLGGSLVTRDERTGETFLKVPVPKPEVLDQALRAVGALLESLRK
jgi:hypothetical protein